MLSFRQILIPESIIRLLQVVMELVMLVSFIFLRRQHVHNLLVLLGADRTIVLIRVVHHPLVSFLIEAVTTQKMDSRKFEWTVASRAFSCSDFIRLVQFIQFFSDLRALLLIGVYNFSVPLQETSVVWITKETK